MTQAAHVSFDLRSPATLLRALRGASASCLLALLLSERPAQAAWLGRVTGFSPNTISEAMDTLLDLGLVEHTRRSDWRLAPGLRSLLVCASPAEPGAAPSIRALSPGLPEWAAADPEAPGASPASIRAQSSSNRDLDGESESESQTPVAAELISSPAPVSGIQPELADVAGAQEAIALLEVGRVLEATALLFDERVHGPPERYPDARLLLASIAEAYHRRARLRKPARVVFANLRNGDLPAEKYLQDPLTFLPAAFLERLGLPLPASPVLADPGEWASSADLPHELPEAPPQAADGSLRLAVRSGSGLRAGQAWDRLVDRLRGSVSPGSHRSYLQPARLLCFEPQTASFTILAPDERSRLWLETNLGRLAERHLAAICARPVRVGFVTKDP